MSVVAVIAFAARPPVAHAPRRLVGSFVLVAAVAASLIGCGGGGSDRAAGADAAMLAIDAAAGTGIDDAAEPAGADAVIPAHGSTGTATDAVDRSAAAGNGPERTAEPAGSARAVEVTGWNTFASHLVAANLLPGPQTYVLAVTQIAVHDALNAIEPKYASYAYTGSAPGASIAAAIAAAARDSLVRLVPQATEKVDAEYGAALSSLPEGAAKDAGIATGRAAAPAILELRRSDDLDAAIGKPYTPRAPVPGAYQPTPPLNSTCAGATRRPSG